MFKLCCCAVIRLFTIITNLGNRRKIKKKDEGARVIGYCISTYICHCESSR